MDDPKRNWEQIPKINRDLLAPLQSAHRSFFVIVGILACFTMAGLGGWVYQIETGIGQTNMHKPVFWAMYIASFIFWIGVSHAGTFISGVLRLTRAEWRRPVARVAELMTVISNAC